ncbi:MAG: nuclear transport factor 2 family protein [Acidobacteria bacterium]|nr:nuclear transport factor 2 family protein [Acidobacteriota bacterium]
MNNSQQINYRIIFFILSLSLITYIFNQSTPVFAQNSAKKKIETKEAKMGNKSIEEIEKVLSDQVLAWNKGNLEGFMDGYWQSESLSFYSGKTTTNGWQQTLDRYRLRYQSEGKEMGTLTFKDLEIEMLGTNNAFVRGKWQLELKSENVGGLFTLVLKKFPNGWRVIHDHTS